MATIKIQPVPGQLLVKPTFDRLTDITITMAGGSSPKMGKIIRMPMIVNKLRSKEVASCSDHIPLKVGDVVFYNSENPTTFTINDEDYHLISNWDIIAKEG